MASAVVFAYHNVGVRCLSVLLAHGIQVKLVVTHADNEGENIWFDSVANLATLHRIPVISPSSPNTEDILSHLRSLQPDFIFSYLYIYLIKNTTTIFRRHLIAPILLQFSPQRNLLLLLSLLRSPTRSQRHQQQ